MTDLDGGLAPPLQPLPRKSRFSSYADDNEAIYSRYESPTSPYSPVFHEQREASPALSASDTLNGSLALDAKFEGAVEPNAPLSPALTGVRVRFDNRSPNLAAAASFPPSASVETHLTYGVSSHGGTRPSSSIYENEENIDEKSASGTECADDAWLLRDGTSRFGYRIGKHKRKIVWGIVCAGAALFLVIIVAVAVTVKNKHAVNSSTNDVHADNASLAGVTIDSAIPVTQQTTSATIASSSSNNIRSNITGTSSSRHSSTSETQSHWQSPTNTPSTEWQSPPTAESRWVDPSPGTSQTQWTDPSPWTTQQQQNTPSQSPSVWTDPSPWTTQQWTPSPTSEPAKSSAPASPAANSTRTPDGEQQSQAASSSPAASNNHMQGAPTSDSASSAA